MTPRRAPSDRHPSPPQLLATGTGSLQCTGRYLSGRQCQTTSPNCASWASSTAYPVRLPSWRCTLAITPARRKLLRSASSLRSQGYRNAAPFVLPTTGSAPASYIQIALRGRNRDLDWRALGRAGTLYVDATDGVVKVVTGPYASPAAATRTLSDIPRPRIFRCLYQDHKSENVGPGRRIRDGHKKAAHPDRAASTTRGQ